MGGHRSWPWWGIGVFFAVILGSYLSPELGAPAEIARLQALFGWSEPAARLVVIAWRKLLHLLGYGLLGLSLVVLLGRRGISRRRRVWLALLLAAGVAALDELVQSRIAWRTGLVQDTILDVVAAVLAVGVVEARNAGRPEGEKTQ